MTVVRHSGLFMPPRGQRPSPPEPPPPQNGLLRGLTAYWKFDAGLQDSIGDFDLTGVDLPGLANGVIGQSRTFNGSSQYVWRPAPAGDLATGDISYTGQIWVYLYSKSNSTGTNQTIWSRYDWDSGISFFPEFLLLYNPSTDRFTFYWYYEPDTQTFSVEASNFGSPSLNTWHLIHFWADRALQQVGLSVNAGMPNILPTLTRTPVVRQGTGTWFGAMFIRATPTLNWWLNGRLDEAGFWRNRVLTADERQLLYNNGDGLPLSVFD